MLLESSHKTSRNQHDVFGFVWSKDSAVELSRNVSFDQSAVLSIRVSRAVNLTFRDVSVKLNKQNHLGYHTIALSTKLLYVQAQHLSQVVQSERCAVCNNSAIHAICSQKASASADERNLGMVQMVMQR